MTFRSTLIGSVFINQWSNQIGVQDVDDAFNAARDAHAMIGRVTNIAVLAEGMKIPDGVAIERMRRDREKMMAFHRSIHYLLLVGGFTASRAITLVASTLMIGTRGVMHFHKTAKEAIDTAASYGDLNTTHDSIYRQLQLYGVQDERLGR